MKTYKFFLDNIEINDDPKGWDEASIKISRNDNLNALLYEYTSDLVFHGDGYTYIKNQLDTNGFCDKVEIRIDKICESGESYYNIFEGIMNLREIKVDEWKCEITCNAEDNNLDSQIQAFADNEFDLGGTKGMGWSVTAPTPRKLGLWDMTGTVQTQRTGYYVIDVLQYLVDCMTKGVNNVTVVSNYFQNDTTQRYITKIKFLNTSQLTNPPNFNELKWTNYLGVQNTINIPHSAVLGTALGNVALLVTQGTVPADVRDNYYTNDFNLAENSYHDGVDTVTIETDLPFGTIDSFLLNGFSGFPISYTRTDFQTGTDGMKYLSIMTGGQLRGASNQITPIISFKDIYIELVKEFNLGMSLTNIGGNITMRIEPVDYFFSQSESITIENVPNLKYEISSRFTKDQIKVGDGSPKEGRRADLINQNTWYSGTFCQTQAVDCNNKYIVDWNSINNQITTTDNKYDEKIYLIECTTGTLGADADSIRYTHGYNSTIDGYTMNNHLTNYWKIRRWLFSMSGNAVFGNKTIVNHNTVKPSKEFTFEYPLTFEQFKTIRNNRDKYIIFRKDNNILNNRLGWIEEVSYTEKTGLTSFKLITI
jgi:hypothetical protein